MDHLDIWDGALLAIAAYVAVISLVRLMAQHRKQLTDRLHQQLEAERKRKKAEEEAQQQLERKRTPA